MWALCSVRSLRSSKMYVYLPQRCNDLVSYNIAWGQTFAVTFNDGLYLIMDELWLWVSLPQKCMQSYSGPHFPHSKWIRRDTELMLLRESEAYLESYHSTKIECFAKIVNGF